MYDLCVEYASCVPAVAYSMLYDELDHLGIYYVWVCHCIFISVQYFYFFTVLCVKHADGCQIEAQVIVMRANSWIKSIVCWDSDERKDGNAKNKRAMFVSVNPAVVFYWYHIRDQVINVVFFLSLWSGNIWYLLHRHYRQGCQIICVFIVPLVRGKSSNLFNSEAFNL